MRELDLHGMSHFEAESAVEDWVRLWDPPFRIITGQSERMRVLVSGVLEHYRLQHYVPAHNAGEIIVID